MNQSVAYRKKLTELARQTASESCVLLHNENRTLPFEKGAHLAVFGVAQLHYYASGLGSGGLVNTDGMRTIWQALEAGGCCTLNAKVRACYEDWARSHPFQTGDGWAAHPWTQEEMPLTDEMLDAAQTSDAALIVIGRTAGEDKDNADVPGSWRLTEAEERLIAGVCAHFEKSAVLLNVGNIMDMTWVARTKPGAVLYAWQGGEAGADGTVDVLFGACAPSGRLTDTIAIAAADYPCHGHFGDEKQNIYAEDIYVGYRYFETFCPERVLYPFGAGLSYTTFAHEPIGFIYDGETVTVTHRVTNTGDTPAPEVVQGYAQPPQGRLGKPRRVLCGFATTERLAPGETAEVSIRFGLRAIASYDDGGATGHKSCWVLEAGVYRFFAGHDVRQAVVAGGFTLDADLVLERLEEACAPRVPFRRLRPGVDGLPSEEDAPLSHGAVNGWREAMLPAEIPQTGHRGITLPDVAEGKAGLNDFIAQLTDEELCCIVRGEGMSSPRVTPGTAGAIGGVSDGLTELGIPAACCADGPSGIRMDCGNRAFFLPSGTAQACTWNPGLIQALYACEGMDMRKNRVDMLLAPGMNIHRSPLNGRNFEYFSEDPLMTGRMACAQLEGLHQQGVTGVIKHFACNSQEHARRTVEAVVSERALREIYLRGFEMAVREGGAWAVMSSYNPLNGVYTASSHDLLTVMLRRDWGFDGIVMTDWWAFGSNDDLTPSTTYVASMVRAQNDLFMVANNPASNSGGDDSVAALSAGTVTRAEYQRCAMNICKAVMRTHAFRRLCGQESEIDRQLEEERRHEGDVMLSVREVQVDEEAMVRGDELTLNARQPLLYQMRLCKRGVYAVRMRYRVMASVQGVTQVSLAVTLDGRVIGMESRTGEDHAWHEAEYLTGPIRRRLIGYLRFFTATGGIELDEVHIKRVEILE